MSTRFQNKSALTVHSIVAREAQPNTTSFAVVTGHNHNHPHPTTGKHKIRRSKLLSPSYVLMRSAARFLDFEQVWTIDFLMGGQSSSDSIPLTSQHTVDVIQSGSGWEKTYKKDKILGTGACAEVFQARNRYTNEIVALKVSKESGEDLRRFSREVATLREIQHPNVIKILNSGDGWYAMPIATGNLTDLAPELSDEERIDVVFHAAKGLAAVHAAGRVHRDVSPNNILRIGDCWVVSDFGFVKKPQGTSSVPKTERPLGTRGYMSPEVRALGGHHANKCSDIYSLGQVIVFMTTGKSPQPSVRSQVPIIWEHFVEKMTMEGAYDRFQTMDETLAALPAVQKQLKAQRRSDWSTRHKALEELRPQEKLVLARIIHQTKAYFHEHEIRTKLDRGERSIFNIGLLALHRRKFIEDHNDDHHHGGSRLTEAARDWLIDNADFLDDFPHSEPESTQDDEQDDGIPF